MPARKSNQPTKIFCVLDQMKPPCLSCCVYDVAAWLHHQSATLLFQVAFLHFRHFVITRTLLAKYFGKVKELFLAEIMSSFATAIA